MTLTPAQGATQAIRFLRQFYKDLAAMIKTCDQLLGAKGWQPPHVSKIADVSNSLEKHNRWTLTWLLRIYVRSNGGTHEAIGILPVLELKGLDQAVCLVVRGQFAKPQTHKRIWDNWQDATPIIHYLMEHPDAPEVPLEVLRQGAMQQAVSGRAFLVPLAELVDRDAVRERLVEPLLR